MAKINYYHEITKLLNDLQKEYPTFGIGRHISTATAEYGDLWGISDKEMFHALSKYRTELELDKSNVANDDFVNAIVEDGKKLFDTNEDLGDDLEMTDEDQENDGY